MMEGINNYSDIYCKVLSWYANPVALSHRVEGGWTQKTTQEFLESVKFLSLGLRKLGLNRGDTLGLLGNSSLGWISLDFAAILAGCVTVPFFANISEKNFRYQMGHAAVRFFFVSGEEEWGVLQKFRKDLKAVIRGNQPPSPDSEPGKVVDYEELLKMGRERHEENPQEFAMMMQESRGEDLATIIFTSGSTGVPKGVELTQAGFITNVRNAQSLLPSEVGVEKALSCLPIAHIYERSMVLFYLCSNISLYIVDDILNTGDLAREIKPDMITVVPRLLEKIYAKMYSAVESSNGIRRLLGRLAIRVAKGELPLLGKILAYPLNRLIFSRFRESLGGKIKLMFSGGAPLSPELTRFFPSVGIPVCQGYGMTECPFISINLPWKNQFDSVGMPVPGVEVKLGEDSEILVRGPAIMRGYHHCEEENERVLKDGWLHTGDRGIWLPKGYLKISGRMKELLKTSNGKYVSPVPIEQSLCSSPLVESAIVLAEGRKFPSCLIFLSEDEVQKRSPRIQNYDWVSEIFGPEINVLIERVNENLNSWERLRKYQVIPRPPSIEEGELTPTMKIRRFAVEEKYKGLIDSMYKELGDQTKRNRPRVKTGIPLYSG